MTYMYTSLVGIGRLNYLQMYMATIFKHGQILKNIKTSADFINSFAWSQILLGGDIILYSLYFK